MAEKHCVSTGVQKCGHALAPRDQKLGKEFAVT